MRVASADKKQKVLLFWKKSATLFNLITTKEAHKQNLCPSLYFLFLVVPKWTCGFWGLGSGYRRREHAAPVLPCFIRGRRWGAEIGDCVVVAVLASCKAMLGRRDGEQKSVIAKQRGLTDLGASEWV